MILKRLKHLAARILRKCLNLFQDQPNLFVRFPPERLFSHLVLERRSIDPLSYPDRKKYLLSDCTIASERIRAHCQSISSIDEVPVQEIKGSIFYIYFQCDSDAIYHVKRIIEHGGTLFPPLEFENTTYRFVNRRAYDVTQKSWSNADRLSHLIINVHENICEAIEVTSDVVGDYVEIGVFLGGSAYTALNYLKAAGIARRAWLLDTFDGFNYEQARLSADAIWTDTHQLFGPEKTMQRISSVLQETGANFRLIEANVCTADLPAEITSIAVANIDVDLYEATAAALAKVAPLMALRGIIICEDPTSTPGLYGACVAMHEFLESNEHGRKFLPMFKGGQYFLIKVSE